MFCSQCGKELNDGVKFCPECGTPTMQKTEAPAPVEEAVVEAPAPVEEAAVEAPAPVEEAVVEAPDPVEEAAVEAPAPVEEAVVEAPAPVEEAAVEAPAPVEENVVAEVAQPYVENAQPVVYQEPQYAVQPVNEQGVAVMPEQLPVQENVNVAPPATLWVAPAQEPKESALNKFFSSKKNIAIVAGAAAALIVVILAIVFRPIYIKDIDFALDKAEVDLNDKFIVQYTVSPDNTTEKELEWTVSDDTVAKIENGEITPLSEGECIVTAESKKGVKETLLLTVKIMPKDITLSNTSANLSPGKTLDLEATIEPENVTDDTVKWSSSDESIAKVDENGKVTAVAIGSCKITATTSNGLTADCSIVVNRPYEDTLIIGRWEEDYTVDHSSDYSGNVGTTIEVNEDHTYVYNLDGKVYRGTWKFVVVDKDGDYKYSFTNTNGVTSTVYVIQDTSNSAYGCMSYNISTFTTWLDKSDNLYT